MVDIKNWRVDRQEKFCWLRLKGRMHKCIEEEIWHWMSQVTGLYSSQVYYRFSANQIPLSATMPQRMLRIRGHGITGEVSSNTVATAS